MRGVKEVISYQLSPPQADAPVAQVISSRLFAFSRRLSRFSQMITGHWLLITFAGMLACMPVAGATQLDDQVAAFKKADKQTEAAVANLLKAGLDEKRAAEALVAVQRWLADNPSSSQAVLYYAGLSMQYAGDWPGAVTFYRKFLKSKSLDPKLAGYVVNSTYRLLLNDMREVDSAYLLMREDGNRLREYGRAKQFDQWFIDEAKRRNDVPALCERIGSILSTMPTNVVPDTADLEWVCGRLESFKFEDKAWYPAALNLASVPQVPDIYKARLQWAATVVPYNSRLDELRDIEKKQAVDPKFSDKPLAAAAQLLQVDPDKGAFLVANGWGVEYDHIHSGNCQKRFDIEGRRKLAQLLDAIPRMSSGKRAELLAYPIAQGRVKFDLKDVRKIILQFPDMLNTLTAGNVPLYDKTLTVAEARALAPLLARNRYDQAALVRGLAAAGTNNFSGIAGAIMKSEMWRFDSPKVVLDLVWNCGAVRDMTYQEVAKLSAKSDARYEQLSKQVNKNATSKDRLAAFNTLQGELLGANPSIPGLPSLWEDLFANAPEEDQQQMLKMLIVNLQGDREYLLSRVLPKCRAGGHPLYWQTQWTDNFMINPGQRSRYYAGAAPLVAELQRILSAQARSGSISEILFGIWMHAANPQDLSARTLMKTLVESPAYAKISPAYQRGAADENHFGYIAKPAAIAVTDPEFINRELLDLPENASPAAVETAFKAVMLKASQAPAPVAVYGLQKVAALPTLSDETRGLLLMLFNQLSPIGEYPRKQGYEQLAVRLIQDMQREKQWGAIVPYAASLWRSANAADENRVPKVADALTSFSEAAEEAGHHSAAMSIARNGLNSGTDGLSLKGIYNPQASQARRARLSGIAGKAALALGAVEIPVDETNPAYGIYKSNAEFVQGNLDSAWSLYKANESQLRPQTTTSGEDGSQPDVQSQSLIRKLSVEYCFWLMRRNIEEGRSGPAEVLVKELTIWSREAEGTFSLEQEAELKIAYADLAFVKGALPTARAWYRKVADAREYKDSAMYVRAALGSVKVDRVSKNFGAALEELDKLIRVTNASTRARVHYARAEVLMDQENYKDALDEIDAVLRGDPNHADALILRGKIQYQMRKLVEASEIELGVSQENKIMVPGQTLKINLNDPTLSVSGVGADIEVEVWAKSGDRELILLHQFGDSKDKFRAEVTTVLAAPVSGDKTLQVLGKDEIRFGYSKGFRAKMKDLPADPNIVIGIASDAHLSMSAGAFPPREGERKLDIEELGLSTAQRVLGTRAVRPGNPVYIRVIDPDQSKTAGIDELAVSMQTSSGDEIRRLLLKETGPYTGEFEAIVPTAGAQAMAFASETAPGSDPNMAISSKSYPGWLGKVGDKETARTFGVDLNDNVDLSKMAISFTKPGNELTRFVLQTSMNGREWTTRARYPENTAPWDGHPRVSSFPTYRGGLDVSSPKGRELPPDWSEKMELTSAKESCNYLAATVPNISGGILPIVNTGHPDYPGLIQFRALFYQPAAAIRRFRLTGYPSENTVFLIDGTPTDEEADDPLTIERELTPGLHEIQVWRNDGRDKIEKSKPVLMCDVSGKEDMLACPDSMFDPATFPAGVRAQIPQSAKITKADGGLDVAFSTNTRARLVRLVILGFNGVAPEIKSITLADRDGKAHLPVAVDFMTLRQNNQLEVLPGDQITVRYEDEVTATPKRNRHEQRLQVAFNTASITASFLKYKTSTEDRVMELEPIRRFEFNDSVAIVIDDADMDSSPKMDTVDFKVATSDGTSITLKAVETEEHSGRFVGRVFPVAGKPSRDSEVQMSAGGTLTATYRDMENLNPGIPADRSVTIEHAKYVTPQIGVYNVTSEALPPSALTKDSAKVSAKKSTRSSSSELVEPRRALNYAYLDEARISNTPLKGIIGASLRFDVVAPHLALAGSSEITAYVQTDAGRKAAKQAGGKEPALPFDVTVPGTLKLMARPGDAGISTPQGYTLGVVTSPSSNKRPLDEGRFSFSVPLILGDRPARSFATKDAEALPSSSIPAGVAVCAGDVVHLGFAYKDEKDQVQWKTASLTIGSHAFLDVMNDSYSEPLASVFVGEKIFVRVLAPGLDLGPDRDMTSVSLKATTGAAAEFQLRETEAHSGIFKGVFGVSYADDRLPAKLPPVELNGFPVRYGDSVVVGYAASGETPSQSMTISVNMGADGSIEPFSKRFTGDEMAVKTAFTQAECWFELAKKHRMMDQESLARREMEHAKKLLAEAIATHSDDELRAHAEYLLGNLSQEYADLAKNDESKIPMYQDALARFSKIPVDYPDTEFAPKAQFKTALVYEKMGETEIAVEEYVKLAYKYPKCEYIPEVMSRLGGYFQAKGQAFKERADPLREKTDVESQSEVIRLDKLSYPEFLKAALIFGKLQARFPDHDLAGLAGLRSAQNYMRANQYEKAVEGFKVVMDNEAYDGLEIRAQAMYWSGLSYERWTGVMSVGNYQAIGDARNKAYQIYRRVTFDFPDSKWAKLARGRLADPVFARIIELEEQARERMLENLKFEKNRKR